MWRRKSKPNKNFTFILLISAMHTPPSMAL
uniref:Uncharacterized protein n=1 Tax=Rhizophora mucronata TaxID=61149 RepID=A0A2P2Q3N0_RHIMU